MRRARTTRQGDKKAYRRRVVPVLVFVMLSNLQACRFADDIVRVVDDVPVTKPPPRPEGPQKGGLTVLDELIDPRNAKDAKDAYDAYDKAKRCEKDPRKC